MRVATQQSATDPLTGTIDMDLIATGRSAAVRAPPRPAAPRTRRLGRASAPPARSHSPERASRARAALLSAPPCPYLSRDRPAAPQARGQIDQLAAALLDALRESSSGASTVAALHAAILEGAAVSVSMGQMREALDQLKAERSVTERAGTVSLAK